MKLKPYKPTKKQPWNLQRVWTIHRRTGFGATWGELQRDLEDGPEKSVDRILDGSARSIGVPENFNEMRQILGESAVSSDRPERLIAWWIYQMYLSPNPLRERVGIMWHNHFATSNAKVKNLRAMFEQNEIFRQCGLDRFDTILSRTIKHPCMLKWLDGDENRVGKANENLGRETLELFTLGVGNYNEADVKGASRALTGWSVKDNDFFEREQWHDKETKSFLGKTGKFDGDDLIEIATQHPATSKRLAWRICDEFLSPVVVDDVLIDQVAQVLQNNELKIDVALKSILRSEVFFSDRNLHRRIMEPESFIVGAVRALELFEPPASTMVLGDWIEQLGRKLFYPPNVGGWPGGRGWLNSRTSIARANFGAALVNGNVRRTGDPCDLTELAERHLGKSKPEQIVGFFSQLLTGFENQKQTEEILSKARQNQTGQSDLFRNAVALIMASPVAQLS